jgi:hypothetical protein
MWLKFPTLRHLLVTAAAMLGGVVAINGFAQEHAAPAQGASSNQPSSSIKAPFNKADGLKNLEQSIFKPFDGFSPQGSLDGVLNSRPSQNLPSVPNKRAREMMDRRKNWVFMTPEEIVTGKTSEEGLGLKQTDKPEDERKLKSPMERYLQRLYGDPANPKDSKKASADRKQKGFGNSTNPFTARDDAEAQDDGMSDLPSSIRDAQQKLKKSEEKGLKNKPESERRNSSFFSDVFALEREKPSAEDEQIERDRLEVYRKSLGLTPTPTFGAKLSSPFKEENDPYRISTPPSLMDSVSKPASLTPTPGVALPNSSLLLDTSARPFSPPSLTPALPKVDPPKSVLPPQPSFAAPRRAF